MTLPPVGDLLQSIRPLLRGARFWRGTPPVEGLQYFEPEAQVRMRALVEALSTEHPTTARSISRVRFDQPPANPNALGTHNWKTGEIVIHPDPGEVLDPMVRDFPGSSAIDDTLGHEFGHARRFLNPKNLAGVIWRRYKGAYDPDLDVEELGATAFNDRFSAQRARPDQPWLFPPREVERGYATGLQSELERWLTQNAWERQTPWPGTYQDFDVASGQPRLPGVPTKGRWKVRGDPNSWT